jgi:hypothetical protein
VHIASFKVYDNKETGGIPQTLISSENRIVPAHSTHVFTIAIAPCLSQVDVWVGSVTLRGVIFGVDGKVFNNIPSAQGLFCSQSSQSQPTNTPVTFINTYVPTPTPVVSVTPLTGSCSASPNSVNTDEHVNWLATASGGTGNYVYSWTGTDGLYGNSSYISKLYYNAGTKTGEVKITDGSQSIVKNCSVEVNEVRGNYVNNYVPYQNRVLAFSQVNQVPLASAVYLSQIPYTGLRDNFGLIFFFGMITLFSVWVAYFVTSYQKNNA